MDAPGLATDPRFAKRHARIENYEALGTELDQRFSRQKLAHWVQALGSNDVPYAPINGVDDVINDPQVAHLGLIVPVESPHGGTRSVRPPVQFEGRRDQSVRAAPLLNEQGAAIREQLAKGNAWPD